MFCTLGGHDSYYLLQHLKTNSSKIVKIPPFFGHSDITNLHLYFHRDHFEKYQKSCSNLASSQLITYYGGAILCQFAMQGTSEDLHPIFVNSLQAALNKSWLQVKSPTPNEFCPDYDNWNDPLNLKK